MGAIRTALTNLATLQGRVAVTDPAAVAVRRVYRYLPPAGAALETPCFANGVTFTRHRLVLSGASDQEVTFETRLYGAPVTAGADTWSDVVVALVEDYLSRLDADPTLAGSVRAVTAVRGHVPTLVGLEQAGQLYVGAIVYVDVSL